MTDSFCNKTKVYFGNQNWVKEKDFLGTVKNVVGNSHLLVGFKDFVIHVIRNNVTQII
jgi:hypothetical protein